MIRRFLSQQGLAVLALLVACSGGAYAAGALSPNSVGARQIKPGAVGNSELAGNAVTGSKVRSGTIGLSDLAPAARPKPPTPLVRQFGTTADGAGCTDDDQNGDVCATVSVQLARPSSLVIQAHANWGSNTLDDTVGPSSSTDSPDGTGGNCVVRVDGTVVPGSLMRVGESASGGVRPTRTGDGLFGGVLATTGFLGSTAAGSHVVDLFCTETDGDLDWFRDGIVVTAAPLS